MEPLLRQIQTVSAHILGTYQAPLHFYVFGCSILLHSLKNHPSEREMEKCRDCVALMEMNDIRLAKEMRVLLEGNLKMGKEIKWKEFQVFR